MNEVGLQLFEQTRVVGDHQHAEVVFLGGCFHAARTVTQGVDVEARVELVENCELRLEKRQLQGLVALLLASRQVDVQRARHEIGAEVDATGFLGDEGVELFCVASTRGKGLAHHVVDVNTGYLGWVLHHQVQTRKGTLPCLLAQQFFAVDCDGTGDDVVSGLAHDDARHRRLAGPVRAHDGVHLARLHGEVDAVQNLLAGNAGLQVGDREGAHLFPFSMKTSSPFTVTL